MNTFLLDNSVILIGVCLLSTYLFQIYATYFKINNVEKHDLLANYMELQRIKKCL